MSKTCPHSEGKLMEMQDFILSALSTLKHENVKEAVSMVNHEVTECGPISIVLSSRLIDSGIGPKVVSILKRPQAQFESQGEWRQVVSEVLVLVGLLGMRNIEGEKVLTSLGINELLLSFMENYRQEPLLADKAADALGLLTSSNPEHSLRLVELGAVDRSLQLTSDRGMYLINDIASTTFETHPAIMKSGTMAEILRRWSDKGIPRAAVQMFGNLAYNEANREEMLRQGVAEKFKILQQESDQEVIVLASSLVLANLVGREEGQKAMPLPRSIERTMVQALEKTNKEEHFLGGRWREWKLSMCFSNLTVSDANKELLFRANLLPHLLFALNSPVADEQTLIFGTLTLWNMAFFDPAAQYLREDTLAKEVLDRLSCHPHKDVHKNCAGTKWLLDNHPHAHTAQSTEEAKEQVMLSYSWAQQPTVLQVRNYLREQSIPVWIDVEAMKGSTLEGMAEAVESSSCILMCVSRAYKQSANCRLEAEYAFSSGKRIVPLMVEADYTADGWLGALVGSKLFFDFTMPLTLTNADDTPYLTDPVFREVASRLLRELHPQSQTKSHPKTPVNDPNGRNILATSTPAKPSSTQPQPQLSSATESSHMRSIFKPTEQTAKMSSWSVEEVKVWVSSRGLAALAKPLSYANVDGRALLMLASLDTLQCVTFAEKVLGKKYVGSLLSLVYELKMIVEA
eukprot:GCRY01002982.1.p1 GENE.GCRY01002982.1~~GCRY01002982.1.p1  ORF type:complete len:685 (+),score=124.67 GCRY01002982.1:99-2153(+)